MPPATGSALILLAAFVLPGFVTVLLQERTFKSADDPTPLDRLLRILYYSVWSYLLLALVALAVGVDRSYVERIYDRYVSDPAQLAWRAALLILGPSIVIATATRYWNGSRPQRWFRRVLHINDRHNEPTSWDFFFRQRSEGYLRVTFPDGRVVLGFYGGRSFASYAKDGRDLYLERAWTADQDGWFHMESIGSNGVWINAGDSVSIEVYDPFDVSQQDTPNPGAPGDSAADAAAGTSGSPGSDLGGSTAPASAADAGPDQGQLDGPG